MNRKLNIIVIGATGYTGKILCRYLHQQGAQSWGVAGRSAEKLKSLETLYSVPSYVIDISDSASLDSVCKDAVCVISCAGPFSRVGMPVVEACVRSGTHYIDSTGEFPFVRVVAERFHEEAIRQNLLLVPCCGFDSVPSDIGNFLVHELASEQDPVVEVKAFVKLTSAGMSLGTVSSIGALKSSMKAEDLSMTSLVQPGGVQPIAVPLRKGAWYDAEEKKWSGPFMMASINSRVAYRSNALRHSTASYVEATEGSFTEVSTLTATSYAMFFSMLIPPVRNHLLKKLSEKGEGPGDHEKGDCRYTMTFVGKTRAGKKLEVVMDDKREMYDVTGIFLAECAQCLCESVAAKEVKSGVLTPSVAFGMALVDRMKRSNIAITSRVVS